MKRNILSKCLIVVPLLLGFLFFRELIGVPPTMMDLGMVLTYPEQILRGAVPHLDFETFYLPGNIWFIALAYRIFGISLAVEQAVGIFYRVALVCSFFAVGRRFGLTAALGSSLCCLMLLLGFGHPAFAWIGAAAWFAAGLFCVGTAAVCSTGSRNIPLLMAGTGALYSVTLLFRHDFVLAVGASVCVSFFRFGWKENRWLIAGLSAGLIPLAWHLCEATPQAVWDNIFLYPVFHTRPARFIPFEHVNRYAVLLFQLTLAALLVNLLAAILYIRRNPRRQWDPAAISILVCPVFLSSQMFQRFDLSHVGAVSILAIPAMALSFEVFRAYLHSHPRLARILRFLPLALPLLPLLVPWHRKIAQVCVHRAFSSEPIVEFYYENHGRVFRFNTLDEYARCRFLITQFSNIAPPGDRVVVLPGDLEHTVYNDTWLYHLLPQYVVGTYFMEMNPGSANRPYTRLASDIKHADWLIVDHRWNRNDPGTDAETRGNEGSHVPRLILEAWFDSVGLIGSFEIYKKRESRRETK